MVLQFNRSSHRHVFSRLMKQNSIVWIWRLNRKLTIFNIWYYEYFILDNEVVLHIRVPKVSSLYNQPTNIYVMCIYVCTFFYDEKIHIISNYLLSCIYYYRMKVLNTCIDNIWAPLYLVNKSILFLVLDKTCAFFAHIVYTTQDINHSFAFVGAHANVDGDHSSGSTCTGTERKWHVYKARDTYIFVDNVKIERTVGS